MAESPSQAVVARNYAVKIRIKTSPRDQSPLEVSTVRTGSMDDGKDAAFHLWSAYQTFEKAWEKGLVKVEIFDPSFRRLEGTIDRIKRKGL